MRDAFGATGYMKFAILFIGIFVSLLAISLNYTKAFRVKNMIINYIEANDGWTQTLEESDIEEYVKSVNYYVNNIDASNYGFEFGSTRGFTSDGCKARGYCIFRQIDNNDGRGVYYKVATFMRIEFPFFDLHLEIPIVGETKIVNENYIKK